MAPSLQAQSPPSPVIQDSTLLSPTYPSFAALLCTARKREQKPGRRGLGREGQSFTPLQSQSPKGHGGRVRLWSQAPHPLETRIAEEGPHKSEIHYCFYSPGTAGDRDPTFTIEL